MSLHTGPLLPLRPLQARSRLAERSAPTKDFFSVRDSEPADVRFQRLSKWFDLNPDGTAKHPDVQPPYDKFNYQKLPMRQRQVWAVGKQNNAMANIMTWAMMENSTDKYLKYKRLVIDSEEAFKQTARLLGLSDDWQPTPEDRLNPEYANIVSQLSRKRQLKVLLYESLRRALGVIQAIGGSNNLLNPTGLDDYDEDLVRKVLNYESSGTPTSTQTSAPTPAPTSGPGDPLTVQPPESPEVPGFAPRHQQVPANPGGGRPFPGPIFPVPNSRPGFLAPNEVPKPQPQPEDPMLGPFPDWMLKEDIVLPTRPLTAKEQAQINFILQRKKEQKFLDSTRAEEQRDKARVLEEKERNEYERNRLAFSEEDLEKQKEIQRRVRELEMKKLEKAEKAFEDENKKNDDGDVPPGSIKKWDPYLASREISKIVNEILSDYEGNDVLKNYIYSDIVAFLGNALATQNDYRNYVFMGPSGVGKTTWARLMGKVYKAVGIYLYGRVAETKSNDYVSNFAGATAMKTSATLNQNLENIILIDEAYSLAEMTGTMGGGNVGDEAITAIVDWMDKNLGCYMMIIAGYEEPMRYKFLANNEGLLRRFDNQFVFEEYSGEQLSKILQRSLEKSDLLDKWMPYTWDYLATLIQVTKNSHEYVKDFNKQRENDLAKAAMMGLTPFQAAQAGFLATMDAEKARWAKMYDILFSKQAGSITLLASKIKKYMLLPDFAKTGTMRYQYDSDLMDILVSSLPRQYYAQYFDKSSEVYQFVSIPLGPSEYGRAVRKSGLPRLEDKSLPAFVEPDYDDDL